MSKPHDKATATFSGTQTGLKNTASNTKNVLPETTRQNEAKVTITIKEVRFNAKSYQNVEVISVQNGTKKNWAIPMIEPFTQEFEKVEDQMIFKFGVTSNNDLLGFLYLEIPRKFKTMAQFKIDEWFPIKKLETEDKEREFFQNYTAKIVMEYQAVKKLEVTKPMTDKLPKNELYQDLAFSLREKMEKLNAKIDAFEDDGFKHLESFQMKMAKLKVESSSKDKERIKNLRASQDHNKLVGNQKDVFYRTVQSSYDEEIKVGNYNTVGLEKTVTLNKSMKPKEPIDETAKYDKMFKELSYSNQELIQANAKIAQLEQKKMTPENITLKKDLEKLQFELFRDRRELNVKLKEAQTNLEKESDKFKTVFEKESSTAISLEDQARFLQEEYARRLKAVEIQEKLTAKKKENVTKKEASIKERADKVASEIYKMHTEREDLLNELRDVEEMKNRMMLERQRVYDEAQRIGTLKSETEFKANQNTTLEEFLQEEKENYQKEILRRHQEIEELNRELDKKKRLHELELQTFEENQKGFERRTAEHTERISKFKIEATRMTRVKNGHAHELVDFLAQKKIYEQERQIAQDEIQTNYASLDEETANLTEQKSEYNKLIKKMEAFEDSVFEKGQIQLDQKAKFIGVQKQFSKKVKESNLDIKELKNMAKEVGVNMANADEKFTQNAKMELEIGKAKTAIKNNIENLSQREPKSLSRADKKSILDKRYTNKNKDNVSVMVAQTEDKVKATKQASNLVDKIFAEAATSFYKKHYVNKQQIIDQLRGQIEVLQQEFRALIQKTKNSKIDFLSNHKESDIFEDIPELAIIQQDATKKSSVVVNDPKPFKILQTEEEKLFELQETIQDLCDAIMNQIDQEVQMGVQIAGYEEKIAFLTRSRELMVSMFKTLMQISSASKNKIDEFKTRFVWEVDLLDYEILKEKYETKLKQLLEFVHELKENNDFFNTGIDSNILSV